MSAKSDLMDHLRSLPDDDVAFAELDAFIRGVKLPYIKGSPKPHMDEPKVPRTIDGHLNPASVLEERDILLKYNARFYNYYGQNCPSYAEKMKATIVSAKDLGIDLKSYAPETFSVGDINRIDDIIERTDVQLELLADRLETSQELGLAVISDVKKKSWAKVLRRASHLQRLCREAVPKSIEKTKSQRVQEVWKYTHAIRYMLWTMRSNHCVSDGTETFVQVMPYLVESAMTISVARHHAKSHAIKGALIQLAPRHGKTLLTEADCALNMCLRPWRVNGVVHNKLEIAQDRFCAIRNHFDDSMPEGRRRRVLFPDCSLDPKTLRGKSKMVLMKGDVRLCNHEEGNLTPRGVHGRVTGMTFHDLLFDDPTDEKEQNESGTRERTNSAMSQTWLRRLTGDDSFFVYICTAWHPQDFASILKQLGLDGHMNIAYFAQACGGPDEDFTPLWAEGGYGREYLRTAYHTLGPSKYACIFQNDPNSPESKRLKRLNFYDESIVQQWNAGAVVDPEWDRFFKTAKYYISIDPSGSDSKYSNLAGITYCAFGTIRVQKEDAVHEVPRVVFLRFWSFPGSQHTLTQLVYNFSRQPRGEAGPMPIDFILVEARHGGFHATADDLVQNHGFPSNKVMKRRAGMGTKVARLLEYAIHLENGDVVFPGIEAKNEHGEMELRTHPSWTKLADQLMMAGSMRDDNLLDCVRQQLAELSHEIFDRKGIYHGETKRTRVDQARQRLVDFYSQATRPKTNPKRGQPSNAAFISRKMVTWN